MVHVGNLLRRQVSTVSNLLFVLACHVEEAFHLRVGAEQFQTQRPGGADKQPYSRNNSYPDVLGALHLNQHNGAQYQRYGCQHLVGDTEQRPQALNAAQRIDHALIQQVAPQTHTARSTDDTGNQRVGFFQERDEVTQQVLQHKAARTGTRIQRGQDEQGFEQNTEVIPEAHVSHRQHFVEHMSDTYRQRRRTTCTVQDRRLTNVFRGLQDLLWRNHEAPGADGRRRVCGNVFQLRHDDRRVLATHFMQVRHGDAKARRRGIHREVKTRFDDGRSNQRHNRHEGLHQHCAVANETRVGFVSQQFRRRTGRDQRVEARYRTTGDGDEQEREQSAFPQRASTVNVLGHRRHFQFRVQHHDTQRQADDNADFQEGCQIVARCEDQPHRQQCGNKRIANQREGNGGVFKGQCRTPVRIVSNHATEVDRGNQQHDTNDRDFTHTPRTDKAHVDTHKQRNRYG